MQTEETHEQARETHERWLSEITALPTAAGREGAVAAWVERWARERSDIAISRDTYGNMLLTSPRLTSDGPPVMFTAHMDHPAFVVVEQTGEREVLGELRGGVSDSYFTGAAVRLHPNGDSDELGSSGDPRGALGRVARLIPADSAEEDKRTIITFDEPVEAQPGQIITWETGEVRIDGDLFSAPACDDLAGLTAALAAFDTLRTQHGEGEPHRPHVQVLLTRCEEVGFIGAIGSCQSGLLAPDAWVINLECSKSIPGESPIGGGPIVRVGDRTSTFHPELMYRLTHIAREVAAGDSGFRHQRKLMPGGTCEASAFLAFGYKAGCICLPLGRYHNMHEQTGRIDAEQISLSDFHHLVQLLAAVAVRVGDVKGPNLRDRLEALFARRRPLVEEPGVAG